MKEIGLFFGTFNPIHVGHLIIANYVAHVAPLREVWLVVTPQNPHKAKATLLDDRHRLDMVRTAVEDNPRLRASDVEFYLPKPSYTVHTLAHLSEKYPDKEFSLIMGEDNLRTLHKWKNHEVIRDRHKIYVYPRAQGSGETVPDPVPEDESSVRHGANIRRLEAPVMNLSSSFVRAALSRGEDVRYILTEPVYRYITDMHFYTR